MSIDDILAELEQYLAYDVLEPGEFTTKMAAERYGLPHREAHERLQRLVSQGIVENMGKKNLEGHPAQNVYKMKLPPPS